MEGCMMYRVVRKLKLLKKKLRVLHTKEFQNIVNEADEDRAKLKQAQVKLQTDPSNIEYQQMESQVYQKFRTSSYLAELFLQQRSKATWIRLGDDNTRYFYSIIKHRKLKQAVTQLKDQTGVWQTDPAIIAQLFVDHYEGILGNKAAQRSPIVNDLIRQGKVINEEQQSALIHIFEPHEVKKAMFQMALEVVFIKKLGQLWVMR
ncbi:hypothetical protein KY290_020678 [Solanum tuberosum]|uniref:Uncharacterized protein n=1 Tax=Solanum tuberosum TaxID=4113 RepID=A0ABQ7UZD4_SOLTU|nr:hypothetical protein KY290_020678 [Solanum tuberosum]